MGAQTFPNLSKLPPLPPPASRKPPRGFLRFSARLLRLLRGAGAHRPAGVAARHGNEAAKKRENPWGAEKKRCGSGRKLNKTDAVGETKKGGQTRNRKVFHGDKLDYATPPPKKKLDTDCPESVHEKGDAIMCWGISVYLRS